MEKERKAGYFARLKRKKQTKQGHSQSMAVGQSHSKPSQTGLPNTAQDQEKRAPSAVVGLNTPRPAITSADLQGKSQDEGCPSSPVLDNPDDIASSKCQMKRGRRKPPGTVEYAVGPLDTLNSIALNFNVTPNKLVQLNRLFSRSVVAGQILFVPDVGPSAPGLDSAEPKTSSEQGHSKLLDNPLCGEVKPLHRMLSPASEDEEPVTVKFLKMSCRYFTDGMGVVGGVMIVTPNNIMFDPHKSDPLVIEHGCEEYGLICPMEEVLSIALYDDISRMELKDALPSDLPQGLCPLYRPGTWGDMPSERDLNPFSRFQSPNRDKRPIVLDHIDAIVTETGDREVAENSSPDEGFTELEPESGSNMGVSVEEPEESPAPQGGKESQPLADPNQPETVEEEMEKVPGQNTPADKNVSPSGFALGENVTGTKHPGKCNKEADQPKDTDSTGTEKLLNGGTECAEATGCQTELSLNEHAADSGKCSPPRPNQAIEEMNSWLRERMQAPIEDMLLNKEDKSKTPPMFLCFKVGKPMRKSFAIGRMSSPTHQYGRSRKQPEYWFAVPQERVDQLYNFFVQWSPDVYGKDSREAGFVVVEKEELDMIDNFFSDPTPKGWEIITVNEAKRRQSLGSFEDEEPLDLLPVLTDDSLLLQAAQIEKLAYHLPARTQGYPWQLMYSTAVHGTSLKTLYRNLADLDCPVLLVLKDMDNQVFGAFSTHPFRVSEHCYGTGETFLFSFSPEIKVFQWTGENSYFVKGNTDSLQLGGGGGHFGLWLDADLYHGSSSTCSTFRNQPLSAEQDFTVQDLEVWAFQ
ncbi:nuclear receptor coactivator 7 isoform X1 [Conger conger]|uniref:nuclear receptor coactivator 7 isoform X1 n=1 Tax=Conger conger TaxID=82655 RepID=UPI002A5A914E|nr:nuclear receptor coactivator 7 isoform X1 [Conger conger]